MKRPPIEQLRKAVEMLPLDTRVAMLQGIRSNDIIIGAYADRKGGVCPGLAAHRCGGRTDFLVFARAWDRFGGAKKRSRRATERELRILTAHLESSILAEQGAPDELKAAVVDHTELVASRPRPGDPDRSRELGDREGWAWLRPFRRYDEYAAAIRLLEAEQERLGDEEREETPVG